MKSSLRRVINNLFLAAETSTDFEIIVSDNCSEDDTQLFLNQFISYPFFRYYRNNVNEGFKNNMFLLTDSYAKGVYCWIIGDDDLVAPEAIKPIISILKEDNIDYLSVRHHFILNDQETLPSIIDNEIQAHYCSYGKAIDSNSKSGNTFACFIGASIFRTDSFRQLSKSEFSSSFVEFYNIFPNAYLLGKAFSKSKSAYIDTPVIYPVFRRKDWATEDTMYKLLSVSFFEMYNHLLAQGINRSDLKNTYGRLLTDNVIMGTKRLLSGKPVKKSFFISVFKVLMTPRLFGKVLSDSFKIVKNKVRN